MAARATVSPVEGFLARGRLADTRVVVLCAGDSHTRGTTGSDWVGTLAERLPADHEVVNAGADGDLASDLVRRLGPLVACAPDVVTIQVGTNDVAVDSERQWVDGSESTSERFAGSLRAIVRRLRTETGARIAVLDLPMLGEDLTSALNEQVRSYNRVVQQVARAEGAVALPVHDRLVAALTQDQRPAPFDSGHGRVGSALQRGPWLSSSDARGSGHGRALLTDGVHLNDRAGALVAELVAEFVLGPEGRA